MQVSGWRSGEGPMWRADIKLLRSFASIAREGSLTKAASSLNLTQPAVSGHLKDLECQLGFRLFERSTRQIALTAHGSNLLESVTRFLGETDLLERRVHAAQMVARETFRLGATHYILDFAERIELLDAFEREFPHVQYSIDNFLQVEQVPKLISGSLDISLLLGFPVGYSEYNDRTSFGKDDVVNELVYPDSLENRVLLGLRRVELLVPQESDLANFEIIPLSALSSKQIAMLGVSHGAALIRPILALLERCGAYPVTPPDTNSMAVNRYATINRIAAVDLGWHPPTNIPNANMIRRPLEGLHLHTEFAVVLGKEPTPAALKFFAFARKWATG